MSNIIHGIFGRKKNTSGATRDIEALAKTLERDALHLTRTNGASKSHFGGDPRLPRGTAWPQRGGKRLKFLARVALAQLQGAQATPWLPSVGALLFFYDDDNQPWGFDPADRGGWAVLHVPDVSATSMVPANESSELLPHLPVVFRPIRVLPSGERPEVEALNLSDEELDRYFEIADQRFGALPRHQLLGVPSPVQNDSMELECQLASNGVTCGGSEDEISAREEQLEAGAENWRLLFQMDSDDDLDVMWGDAGMLYFWVEESAARRGDFSNVWLVLQCF